MTEGFVDVHTAITVEHYKRLHQLATLHDTTVGALVAELTRRALTPKRIGRPTKYTPALGERIWDDRWMHRTWEQIAEEEHIAVETAKKYHARYVIEHPTAGGRAA
ncbi:hypothetical protein IT072_03760 [Leifsonia sp. ZF2019]|uniref:hypothetical protein n=1 Tax=Leifsonia sp. ZF2019 TaxID=2781978 RepID=UPI001CBB964B|nr:hypothetical protein [Leifsonia sp. ZF2019]UAJ80174.1 hypothetical protein IT072_03760 [Leifsonia sp. ZF2019]